MAKSSVGGLKINGIPEAVEALKRVAAILGPERIQDCLLVGADMIKTRARQLAPVGRGLAPDGSQREHLRDAIFAVKGKMNPAQPSVIVGVSIKRAPHAHLIEYKHDLWKGGKKKDGRGYFIKEIEPEPFMRPALDKSRKDIPALVGDMIKRTLQSFGINVS